MRPANEEKGWWVIAGAEKERAFVDDVLPRLGFSGGINPEKATNRYAPDLLVEGHLADLKCQRTPFFRALDLYGIDPQHAVTFNRKDFERYRSRYPSLDIFFWLDWQETTLTLRGREYRVEPMAAVYRASFPSLRHAIEAGRAPLHEYQARRGDTQGNARDSYLFDSRRFELLAGSSFAQDSAWTDAA